MLQVDLMNLNSGDFEGLISGENNSKNIRQIPKSAAIRTTPNAQETRYESWGRQEEKLIRARLIIPREDLQNNNFIEDQIE